MKNKVYNLTDYSFKSGESILLDTNIWLYLFPAPSSSLSDLFDKYSRAFNKLVKAQAQPVIDPMVLSEYLNRYCRIEWIGNFPFGGFYCSKIFIENSKLLPNSFDSSQ